MRKSLNSAPARLALLMPFVNDPTNIYSPSADIGRWEADAREALDAFVSSFDGSVGAGHVAVFDDGVLGRQHTGPDELQTLHVDLNGTLEYGLDHRPDLGWSPTFSLPTLRLAARNMLRPEIKRSRSTRREQRAHDEAGAFVLYAAGSLRDLVLFLTLHLLAADGMSGAVRRCQAPAVGNRRERCGKWFVRKMGPGQPRLHCTDNCRVRFHDEHESKRRNRSERRKA